MKRNSVMMRRLRDGAAAMAICLRLKQRRRKIIMEESRATSKSHAKRWFEVLTNAPFMDLSTFV